MGIVFEPGWRTDSCRLIRAIGKHFCLSFHLYASLKTPCWLRYFLLFNFKFDHDVKQRCFTKIPKCMYHRFFKTQGVRYLNSIALLSACFNLYQQHFHFAQASYLSATHLKPICSVPESADVFIRAATR